MYPFSSIHQSMLNLFCHCQVAFYHRYVEGQKIPPAIAARVGTSVHKAAEVNHKQKIASGCDMLASELMEIASDEFARIVKDEGVYFVGSTQELHKELGKGEDLAVSLTKAYTQEIAPKIRPIRAEITLSANHPELPLPFEGTIDVVDESHTIIDLKTAKTKWASGKEKATTQVSLYKYLYTQETGKSCAFAFYVMPYTGGAQYVPTESGIQLGRALGIAQAMLNACRTGIFAPAEPGHWMCSNKWCGWYGEDGGAKCRYVI